MSLRIAWFFDGGGCRGVAVEIKQARALGEFCRNRGIPYENMAFAGISIGAIIAAFLGQAYTWNEFFEYLDELDNIAIKFNSAGPEAIFDVSTKRILIDSRHRSSILEPDRLYNLIDGKIFGSKPLDVRRVIQSPIPVHILTTNMKERTQETFTTRQALAMDRPHIFRDVIVASASLPPFFPEIVIDGVRHRDGARINLGSLIKAGYDIIFILISQPRPKDFTEIVNDWYWWPWIPPIFEYQSAVGDGMEKSELRQVRKKALEKTYDVSTLEIVKEAREILVAQHHLPEKKQLVRDVLGKIMEHLEYRVGDRHIAYPVPLYSPKLPSTLRVESFRKEEFVPQDVTDKQGIVIQKKDTVIYEGDLKKVGRETYSFAKEFLDQVDLDNPEKITIF